jgi:hypothetical protein
MPNNLVRVQPAHNFLNISARSRIYIDSATFITGITMKQTLRFQLAGAQEVVVSPAARSAQSTSASFCN